MGIFIYSFMSERKECYSHAINAAYAVVVISAVEIIISSARLWLVKKQLKAFKDKEVKDEAIPHLSGGAGRRRSSILSGTHRKHSVFRMEQKVLAGGEEKIIQKKLSLLQLFSFMYIYIYIYALLSPFIIVFFAVQMISYRQNNDCYISTPNT